MLTQMGSELKTERRERWLTGEHVVSSSICPTSVRTVILMAWCDHDDSDKKLYRDVRPVIAIESRIVEAYRKKTSDENEAPILEGTRRDLLARGYRIFSRSVEIIPIFVDSEFGLTYLRDDDILASNEIAKPVACSWPQEQDEERLGPIFANLEEQLMQRIESDKEYKERLEARAANRAPKRGPTQS